MIFNIFLTDLLISSICIKAKALPRHPVEMLLFNGVVLVFLLLGGMTHFYEDYLTELNNICFQCLMFPVVYYLC